MINARIDLVRAAEDHSAFVFNPIVISGGDMIRTFLDGEQQT